MLRRLFVLFAALPLCGCAGGRKAPPLPPPRAQIVPVHFSGTPLSGPRPVSGAVAALPALDVQVQWLALKQSIEDAPGLIPVGESARLVLATRDRQPVQSTSRLTTEARWCAGEAAETFADSVHAGKFGQTVPMFAYRSVVPVGITFDTRAANPGQVDDPAATPLVELFLQPLPHVGAPANTPGKVGALQLALSVQDIAILESEEKLPEMNAPAEPKNAPKKRGSSSAKAPAPSAPDAEKNAENAVLSTARELVVLPPLPLENDKLKAAVVLPSRFGGSPAQTLVVLISAVPAVDDPETQQLLAETIADVRRRGDTSSGTTRPSTAPSQWPGYASALSALDRAEVRRRAMVFLASHSEASLCENVALIADDTVLQQLAADIRGRAAATNPPFSTEALGQLLDLATLEWATRLAGDERLPPEVAAVLSSYAGEAGRKPASLEELVRSARESRAALKARLVSENMIYLDDISPAARVRALDWLSQHGRAPAGYDPLASPRQRRDALERAIEAAAQASTQPTATTGAARP